MDLSESPPKTRRTSWYRLLGAIPMLVFAFLSFAHAMRERTVAASQQTTVGTILECKHVKGGSSCSYEFDVDETHYLGRDGSSSDSHLGQAVMVYYDAENPSVNALEDFAGKAKFNFAFALVLLVIFIAVVAFFVYFKAKIS